MSHLKPLTSLRFFAALFVVLAHFTHIQVTAAHGPYRWVERILGNLTTSGYVGVNFFFILSGFILFYSYITDRGSMRVSPKQFWVARVARIYPVYLLAILLGLIPFFSWTGCLSTVSGCVRSMDYSVGLLTSITATQAWSPHSFLAAAPLNGPGWSISVEALFYLAFPLLAPLVARLGERGLCILALSCWALLMALSLSSADPWSSRGLLVAYNPLLRLPEFTIGLATGCLFMRMRKRERVPTIAGMPIQLVAIGTLLLIVLALSKGTLPFVQLRAGLLDPLFALAIYSLAFGGGRLSAVLSFPLLVLLGEASYSLYLLQMPIYEWTTYAVQHSPLGIRSPMEHPVAFFIAFLIILLALSIMCFLYIEQPARKMLRRKLLGSHVGIVATTNLASSVTQ